MWIRQAQTLYLASVCKVYNRQKFDHAEAAGRIAENNRNIRDLETRLEQAQESEAELVQEGEQLKAEWSSMWDAAPFDPLTAEAMLEWLDAREEVLETIDGRADAEITHGYMSRRRTHGQGTDSW